MFQRKNSTKTFYSYSYLSKNFFLIFAYPNLLNKKTLISFQLISLNVRKFLANAILRGFVYEYHAVKYNLRNAKVITLDNTNIQSILLK